LFILRQIGDDLIEKVSQGGHQVEFRIRLFHYDDRDARNKILGIILENLIENAIHYARGNEADIKVNISEDKGEIKILFEDKGIGIDETYFQRIFGMYFGGSELSKGNRLGLYVVKSGVKKLDGKIRLKSKRNDFTCFEINFPIEKK
jgi:two-component system phosphate regulon sensor histidine kinase PhoR